MNCKICSAATSAFDEGIILNKYKIKYYKCDNCGFIQTENPYWLEESYSEAINRSDVGYVQRNVILSNTVNHLIKTFFNKNGTFLDYGAGYGLFVRLMRDLGYNFLWQDKYCDNIFAKDFEADENITDIELVTAFELFEHLENPLEDLEKMLQYSDNVLIGTVLYPSTNPKVNEWWYFGVEHGQHIAIYSLKTMKLIAKKYKLNLYSNNKNLHLLTSKKINKLLFDLINYNYLYQSFRKFSPKRSLLNKDYALVLSRLKSGN
jgi:2-polyprenyl-3-methyl-5-hydroxy-6-metoxy-1,4-benzoquinol methylase